MASYEERQERNERNLALAGPFDKNLYRQKLREQLEWEIEVYLQEMENLRDGQVFVSYNSSDCVRFVRKTPNGFVDEYGEEATWEDIFRFAKDARQMRQEEELEHIPWQEKEEGEEEEMEMLQEFFRLFD